ncbi:MAG: NAD(P)H-dependent oxidoreductase [Mediterranea sp.]|jgi:flavodoxin|nr:NAD(P)H-dependent oxidoreductase [Mediterranea sp.]
MKALVAYFSCTGVTERLAHTLAAAAHADLYRIEPAVPYTAADLNWNNPQSRSSLEMQDKQSRPAIKGKADNLGQCDTVFIGFPIWWGIAPTLINTFLENYDFSGKTIVPFATSGGSDVGETDQWLHSSCSAATRWHPAMRFPVDVKAGELEEWLREM